MSQSQVVSFRASGHFLNWIEAQRLEGESVSQAAQRILKEVSGTSTLLSTMSTVSTDLSTPSVPSVVSTNLSTELSTLVNDQLQPALSEIDSRFALMEERLGKLSA